MPTLTKLTFRYRGAFSYEDFYKQTRAFFVDKKMDFAETKHVSKSGELEGKFVAKIKVDMYTELSYEIDYKMVDIKFITVEQNGKQVPMTDGKMRIYIEAKFEDNYKDGSFEEAKPLFNTKSKTQSLIMKIYEKITFRERDEGHYGEGIIVAHQYLDLLKSICKMETRY